MNSIEEYIIREYQNNKSPYEIAEQIKNAGINNWYANKVRRFLKKSGVKIRNKSESQKIALISGRGSHPTKGKHHSVATKSAIGEKISESWKKLSDGEKKKRSETSKINWYNMTDEEKENLRSESAKAIRQSAKSGSKIEKYLLIELKKLNYKVDFHSRTILPTQKFQVDLFLPDLKTAIELDGISHFEPIWGEEALEKTRIADNYKNGLIISAGFTIIRVKILVNKISKVFCKNVLAKLIPILNEIQEDVNRPIEKRLIVIEG